MIPFSLKELNDLQELIDTKTSENLYLEYKSEIGSHKKVTKQVSAFANSSGGYIIYGIREEKDVPTVFCWIDRRNAQETIENFILAHIQPSLEIGNYKIKPIKNPGNSNQAIYIVKIEKSLDAPHMASDKKYYIRREKQSVPMEDKEVRETIFKSGLRDALKEEVKYNEQLALKISKKCEEIMCFEPEERQTIAFTPFRTEAWKAALSSGLFNLIRNNMKDLINFYNIIHELNYIIELQKNRLNVIVTQTDDSSPKYGIYVPAIIRKKAQELSKYLPKIKQAFQKP